MKNRKRAAACYVSGVVPGMAGCILLFTGGAGIIPAMMRAEPPAPQENSEKPCDTQLSRAHTE